MSGHQRSDLFCLGWNVLLAVLNAKNFLAGDTQPPLATTIKTVFTDSGETVILQNILKINLRWKYLKNKNVQEQGWGAKGQCFCKNQQIGYCWDFAMRLDCTIPGDDFMILYSLCIVSAVSGFFSNNCRMYREQNSDSWIHNAYFSLKLGMGPMSKIVA
jgi:hypothetical protein